MGKLREVLRKVRARFQYWFGEGCGKILMQVSGCYFVARFRYSRFKGEGSRWSGRRIYMYKYSQVISIKNCLMRSWVQFWLQHTPAVGGYHHISPDALLFLYFNNVCLLIRFHTSPIMRKCHMSQLTSGPDGTIHAFHRVPTPLWCEKRLKLRWNRTKDETSTKSPFHGFYQFLSWLYGCSIVFVSFCVYSMPWRPTL